MASEDLLEFYEDRADEWRWRLLASGNSEPLCSPNESFLEFRDCRANAQRSLRLDLHGVRLDGELEEKVVPPMEEQRAVVVRVTRS